MCANLASADIRIVLDVSKSMAENDPKNFRTEALELLIDAIPEGEKAGIWTFGQYVNLLVPHDPVNAQWRQNAREKLRQQGAPAIRTNIGRALENVSYDFLFSSYQGPVQVIVITDGRVDIAPNLDVNRVERERILTQLVPAYASANAQIHTIVISKDADHSLLRQMSAQTGGQYQFVSDTGNISRVMSKLSTNISPTSQLALNAKSFDVDSSIREITVLMYHEAGSVSLVAPNGEETSAVSPANQRWRVGNGFSQVSVSAPMQGRWQVKGQVQDASNIRVISNINIEWQKPEKPAMAQGDIVLVEAVVVDESGIAIASDLASVVDATLRVDGELVPLQVQSDKITARIIPNSTKDLINLELAIDGGTFNRLMTRSIRFVDPYISEVLLTENGYEWRLYPNRYLGDGDEIEAEAQYRLNGELVSRSFEQTSAGYWVWILPYDLPPGQYEVALEGQLMQMGSNVMMKPESISLDIPPSAQSSFAMSPNVSNTTMPASDMSSESGEFVKDPMPVFEELQAEIVVQQDPINEEWVEEPVDANQSNGQASNLNIMTYLLLSIPGLLVLVGGYLVYRRIENKVKSPDTEDDVILGGDEFSSLDDMDALTPDSDLDISSLDDFGDDDFPDDAPMVDDVIEEDLPTPEQTEAPSVAVEDMLDSESSSIAEVEDDTETDPEEELFDISSIDDDLADLDLALDGDDPFADDEEENR
jgi:hypothetical protein